MGKGLRFTLSVLLAAALLCGVAGCFAEEPREWTEGNLVTFGRYPQSTFGTDETPIEWIVLAADEENRRALLLSKYGLDMTPYNTGEEDVSWETCSLRAWLNQDFLNRAFTAEEQAAILLTDVDNSAAQGYGRFRALSGGNTRDRLFLLSYAEVKRYLKIDESENVVSRVAPTAYARQRGAYTDKSHKTEEGLAAGWWWLRSPGYGKGDGSLMIFDGTIGSTVVSNINGCVRPVMWVDLDAVSSNP